MAIDTIWTCDGCEAKITMKPSSGTDWKRITVTLLGFKGYPVTEARNGPRTYELCPACQRHLATQADPRQWARSISPNSAGETE